MVDKLEQAKTEELILNAARLVFTQRGYNGARMQEIADEAGINKALLHYYFRSKDKLFEIIFNEAINQLLGRINEVIKTKGSLLDKVSVIVDLYIAGLMEKPFIPIFVLHEMSQDPEKVAQRFLNSANMPDVKQFLKEVDAEIKKGHIKEFDPEQLFINVVSLCIFPFVAKPMIKGVLRKNEMEFRLMMQERKREVVKFITAALQP